MEMSELLQKVNIVQYIGQYTDLKQKGNEWTGLSPFRQETMPSFFVREDPPQFYDFGEGIGGGVIKFTERLFHCSYEEALRRVCNYAHINPDALSDTEELSPLKSIKKFTRHKKEQKECNITKLPNDYTSRYDSNAKQLQAWISEGISYATLCKFDVRYDFNANRLCFPIRNYQTGDIINISGRTLDPDFKEKRIKKYNYYFKFGSIDTLYGFWENQEAIKEKNEVILFEGAKSVMKFEEFKSFGCNNSCAILTSHLNYNQMKFLARLGADVVFALDKDINILADKNIASLAHFVRVDYIYDNENLLGEKDAPVDRGEQVFRKLYEGRYRYR